MEKLQLEETELKRYEKILKGKKEEQLKEKARFQTIIDDNNNGEHKHTDHMADQGTDYDERRKAFLFRQRASDYLKKIDIALDRIKDKTYGICYTCPQKHFIGNERLEATPIATKCCKVKKEEKEKEKKAAINGRYLKPVYI